MFDIGFWELTLIGLLALIVLGPKRLPEAASTAGRWVGKLRQFVANVKRDLNSEIQSGDLAEFRRLQKELVKTKQILEESSFQLVKDLSHGAQSIADDADAKSHLEAKKKKSTSKKKTKKKTKALTKTLTKTTKKKKVGKKAAIPKKKKKVSTRPSRRTKKGRKKAKVN